MIRLMKDPVGVLKRRLDRSSQKYIKPDGYDAKEYWGDRLASYGFDLRGAGDASLSREENERMYAAARETFLSLCRRDSITLSTARVLEIGCGTGFYTGILRDSGVKDYCGVDITDALFPALKEEFPDFDFRQLDVTEHSLEGTYDLVAMIDVTQHITNPDKFSFAMQNIRNHLGEAGSFIVTSWLDESARESFYEVSRSIEAYRREFPGCSFSEPTPFRDKFIFSIRQRPPGDPA